LTREILERDLAEIYDQRNQLKPGTGWAVVWRRGIVKSLKVYLGAGNSERPVVKFTIKDKLDFLELIMRHLGMCGPRIKREEDRRVGHLGNVGMRNSPWI